MSLVAYGSSDDSDLEESPASARSGGGLFSALPAPQKTAPVQVMGGAGRGGKPRPAVSDGLGVTSSTGGILSSLPKPKRRSEPVRIPAPQVHGHDSDSDEDQPSRKRMQAQGPGLGLSSILPQPKNLTVKEIDRPLIPHALTKRQDPKGPKPGAPARGLLGSSASPSAIKAAAKSAALQVARQIATDDQDPEEDMPPQNYFSLEERSEPLSAAVPAVDPEPPSEALPYAFAEEPGQSDAPLDFGGHQEAAGAWGGPYQPTACPEDVPQGFYSDPYYQEANPGQAEEPDTSDMFDDEGFMRLQGKRNRGKEEIKFLEIKGDDQLSGNKQWMTKGVSEEKQSRQSFSKKRGGQPTGQQRRKHQITYLIHQAKERELELKNNWAENRLTRRQTQAKYGF